ncbi:MAG: hypothetical protein CVU47_08110 [Chloroflexi bacterium HGW-Chloroflexi-9]|nr:MAG: hypothetical protein CVU47_08110 [Chloroflexi bacterium HGW-Chloroflexi-9]
MRLPDQPEEVVAFITRPRLDGRRFDQGVEGGLTCKDHLRVVRLCHLREAQRLLLRVLDGACPLLASVPRLHHQHREKEEAHADQQPPPEVEMREQRCDAAWHG